MVWSQPRQRKGKLLKELDLSGLKLWPPELAEAACWLLAKYHDVFSLEPMELSCIHSTEHTIKVTDNTPLRYDLGGSLHPWWKKFGAISERCKNQVPSDLVKVHGAML